MTVEIKKESILDFSINTNGARVGFISRDVGGSECVVLLNGFKGVRRRDYASAEKFALKNAHMVIAK